MKEFLFPVEETFTFVLFERTKWNSILSRCILCLFTTNLHSKSPKTNGNRANQRHVNERLDYRQFIFALIIVVNDLIFISWFVLPRLGGSPSATETPWATPRRRRKRRPKPRRRCYRRRRRRDAALTPTSTGARRASPPGASGCSAAWKRPTTTCRNSTTAITRWPTCRPRSVDLFFFASSW